MTVNPGMRNCRLELLGQSGLFQDAIGGVTRFDFCVHWETPMSDWAVPNFVIALSGAFKKTIVIAQDTFNDRRVVGH